MTTSLPPQKAQTLHLKHSLTDAQKAVLDSQRELNRAHRSLKIILSALQVPENYRLRENPFRSAEPCPAVTVTIPDVNFEQADKAVDAFIDAYKALPIPTGKRQTMDWNFFALSQSAGKSEGVEITAYFPGANIKEAHELMTRYKTQLETKLRTSLFPASGHCLS